MIIFQLSVDDAYVSGVLHHHGVGDDIANGHVLRGICGLAGMWLGPTLLALAASIRAKKGFRTSVKGIFGFFVFVMSWVPIAVLALFRKDQKWDEISHRIEKDVDSLINDRQ